MVRYKIYLLCSIIILWGNYIFSQVFPDSRVDSLLKSGIKSIVNQDYSKARKCFDILNDEYPNLPLGKIYNAATSIAEAYDYAEEFNSEYITSNLESAKNQAEELLNANGEKLWYLYFFALAEGYIAYFDALNGSWLSAISTGVSSISVFEQCKSIDQNFYEAYIAIGTFEYWESRKIEFMHWLPFVSDTKEIGIEQLRTAIDSSSYNTYLAINSLIWIYIDKKDYEAAIKVANEALVQFPSSRLFKWGMARAYEDSDPLQSIHFYKEILISYPERKDANRINEITLKHLIAQQYVKIGDEKTALRYCNEILKLNLNEYEKEKLEKRLERVQKLRSELTN